MRLKYAGSNGNSSSKLVLFQGVWYGEWSTKCNFSGIRWPILHTILAMLYDLMSSIQFNSIIYLFSYYQTHMVFILNNRPKFAERKSRFQYLCLEVNNQLKLSCNTFLVLVVVSKFKF